jgi:transcriptional regulator with XRE-family HTH domain
VELDPELAARLRAARERAGLSQRDVAERIGATQTMVCVWERGRYEPTLTALRRLAEIYGTTAAALIGGVNRDKSTGEGGRRTVADMPARRPSPHPRRTR